MHRALAPSALAQDPKSITCKGPRNLNSGGYAMVAIIDGSCYTLKVTLMVD